MVNQGGWVVARCSIYRPSRNCTERDKAVCNTPGSHPTQGGGYRFFCAKCRNTHSLRKALVETHISDVGVDTVAVQASPAAWRVDAHAQNGRMEKRPSEPVDRKRRGNGELYGSHLHGMECRCVCSCRCTCVHGGWADCALSRRVLTQRVQWHVVVCYSPYDSILFMCLCVSFS